LAAVLFIPSTALVAPIDGMFRLSTLGGAERENVYSPSSSFGGALPQFMGEALAVAPLFFLPGLGFQFAGNIVASSANWRWGLNGGPIYDFGMGKTGLLLAYQVRHYQGSSGSAPDFNGMWLRPAVSFYLPQTNVDLWVSQAVSPRWVFKASEGDNRRVVIPVNEAQVMANFFPPVPVVGKDNLELSLGVRVQNLWGGGHTSLGTGGDRGAVNIGPAGGIAVMPWQNLEVTLARGWFDVNHNKYTVNSGLQYYFNFAKNPNLSLLQTRRQYLEPTLHPGVFGTMWNR
jgi:hypothetical protein